MKSGWLTSEFWLAAATSAVTLFGDFVPAPWRAVVVAVTSAAYAISRAVAKRPPATVLVTPPATVLVTPAAKP